LEKLVVFSFGGAAVSGEGGGYGFGNISEADSIELMHYAYDLGINLFDSAPIYGFGMSEQRIGKAFKGAKRDSVYITSKSGVTWHDTKTCQHDQ
jgi:myo-inositol catabolism protein IolS